MRKILISNPSATNITFLPYIYGVLKSHCEFSPILKNEYEWQRPIFLRDDPAPLLKNYNLEEVDVVGLSCYIWNFTIQCEIAKMIKQANPNALVVAGGPEPDWNDRDFFGKHPYIDIIVMQDGEIAFEKILLQRLRPHPEYSSIPGLILCQNNRWVKTGMPEKPLSWPNKSPYCDEDVMSQLADEYASRHPLAVIFETNRGCPYSCKFCDWGSNTFSKLRLMPEERLKKEIEWFSQKKIHRVYAVDANFGIIERDETIADWAVAAKKMTGWPKIFDLCVAKNHIERVTRINLKIHNAGLLKGALIGFQSTNPKALKAMTRMNMSLDKHREMLSEFNMNGVSVHGTIIIGCPEDTLDDFKKTIQDVLEMGFHKAFRYFLYALLPNAPASDKAYLDQYGIVFKKRKLLEVGSAKDAEQSVYYPRVNYIVKHDKLSEAEWVQGCQYAAFVTCMHNLGLARYLALFYRHNFEISYGEFYEKLFGYFLSSQCRVTENLLILQKKLENFLNSPEEHFYFKLESQSALCEPERFLFLNLIENKREFFQSLESALKALFPVDEKIDDLIRFQKFALFPIRFEDNYNPDHHFCYDWAGYFKNSFDDKFILHKTNVKLRVNIDFAGYDWLDKDKNTRWGAYSQKIIKSFYCKDGMTLLDSEQLTLG